MKKIVLATIPMQKMDTRQVYKVDGNKDIEYEGSTYIPINGILAKVLKKDDDVKVVRIITENDISDVNSELQKKELNELNNSIGAKIEYVDVRGSFDGNSETLEKRFRELLGILDEKSEIIFDMTFGSKMLIPVLFYVLGFAEKFFDADVKSILYSKIDFDKQTRKPIAGTGIIYDMTSLFYLNSLTSVMEAPDGKTALERLDKFFAI